MSLTLQTLKSRELTLNEAKIADFYGFNVMVVIFLKIRTKYNLDYFD